MDASLKRSGGKGTVRLRRPERKRQILEHAKQLFTRLGYQQTTTEKIAHAAEITEPVLYRHFASKKALFLEVLNEVRVATLERWRMETHGLVHPLERLRAVIDLYVLSAADRAPELRLLHRTLLEADDADIADALRNFYLDAEAFLAGLIADGKSLDEFRADVDPRVGAWELIRNALAFTLTAELRIPLYQEPDYVGKAIDCMLGGLR
ncbi:MAG: TetR/AcrR family transcriptional regulator [Gemmataceae bacterium]